ncbi:sulfotransferase family protein [Aegicerativicinus sediminis]|uniref:sulfotransferase family protein n=1 Tax=Aegicerativicinus sediminis TaxID=2893202 RepID=UPI001E4B072E|nr:sulfotransferase [Aegicerativicinus sediminis]
MNRFFPLPIFQFFRIVRKHGGISGRGLKNVPSWLLKVIVFEPLRWIELGFNKSVAKHKIAKDPIFILGFYRSGTSFTHEFLSQDNRLGYHTNYQMILPEIMLGSEWLLSPLFDFICRLFKLKDPIHRIPMSFKYPGEEDGTMTTSLNTQGSQWGYFFPKSMLKHFQKFVMFEHISEREKSTWINDMVFIHKKISYANKGKQLILKSPPNTARIKLWLSIYPKARFIFIHRNPYDVYSSNKRFWEVTHRIYALGSYKSVDTKEIIFHTYSQMMDRYLAEKEMIPKGQLAEVAYLDMMSSPLATMKGIYKTLNLDDFTEIEDRMKSYLAKQKDFKPLRHELPEIEKAEVSEKFGTYITHWNY